MLGMSKWTTPDRFKLNQTDHITFSPKYVPLLLFPKIRTWLHCPFTCPKTEAWQPLGFSPVSTCKPSPSPCFLFCIIFNSAFFFSSSLPVMPAAMSQLHDCNSLLTGHRVLLPTSALLNVGSFQQEILIKSPPCLRIFCKLSSHRNNIHAL